MSRSLEDKHAEVRNWKLDDWTIPALEIRNPKSEIEVGRVQFQISDFEFPMQESSNRPISNSLLWRCLVAFLRPLSLRDLIKTAFHCSFFADFLSMKIFSTF